MISVELFSGNLKLESMVLGSGVEGSESGSAHRAALSKNLKFNSTGLGPFCLEDMIDEH